MSIRARTRRGLSDDRLFGHTYELGWKWNHRFAAVLEVNVLFIATDGVRRHDSLWRQLDSTQFGLLECTSCRVPAEKMGQVCFQPPFSCHETSLWLSPTTLCCPKRLKKRNNIRLHSIGISLSVVANGPWKSRRSDRRDVRTTRPRKELERKQSFPISWKVLWLFFFHKQDFPSFICQQPPFCSHETTVAFWSPKRSYRSDLGTRLFFSISWKKWLCLALPQTLPFIYILTVVEPFGSFPMCLSIIASVKGTLMCTLAHFQQRHTYTVVKSLVALWRVSSNRRPGWINLKSGRSSRWLLWAVRHIKANPLFICVYMFYFTSLLPVFANVAKRKTIVQVEQRVRSS